MTQLLQYKRVLTLAGSDSGGGAGIQADLKTFSALGCYGMSVITSITAQNTSGVTAVHPVPVDIIASQFDAVIGDIGADAIKIGMLCNQEIVKTVAELLSKVKHIPIVVDPVMVAKGGSKLLSENAINILKSEIFPLTTLVTPNIPEAEAILNSVINTEKDLPETSEELLKLGCKSVLIKGGHLKSNQASDYLAIKQLDKIESHWFHSDRIDTVNTHGTGCTLSSAIACYIAHGNSLRNAVEQAKNYVTNAISAGAKYKIGNGHGPLHHMYKFWPDKND